MDLVLESIFDRIRNMKPSTKAGGIGAFVSAVLCHVYIFTNLLLNHDSEWRLYYLSDNLALGRWSQEYFASLNTNFQIPAVIGAVAILFLMIDVMLTIDFLEIKGISSAVMVACLMTTFPVLACQFSYVWMAELYVVALFLNLLAAKVIKYRFGWIAAVLCIAIGTGIYQAQIDCLIALFMIKCILNLFRKKNEKNVLSDMLLYIAVLGIGLLLYYLILICMLKITGTTLSSYKGVSGIGSTGLFAYLKQIPKAYLDFFRFFIKSAYLNNIVQFAFYILLLLFFVAIAYLNVKRAIWKSPLALILESILFLLVPLGFNFITVLTAGETVHMLMIYSFIYLLILFVSLAEEAVEDLANCQMKMIISLLVVILCGSYIWNNYCVSNVAYLKLQIIYENSFALANRITARIESLDGYSEELPVAIVGDVSDELYGGTNTAFEKYSSFTGINDKLLYSTEPHKRTRLFIEDYIGIHMNYPSKDELEMLNESEYVSNMPSYPQRDSIQIVNGIIVVKLGDGIVR